MTNEWQPIETAPKDGTPFLSYRVLRSHPDIASVRFWPDGKIGGLAGGWRYDLNGNGPTHWMPLPTPPATAKDE